MKQDVLLKGERSDEEWVEIFRSHKQQDTATYRERGTRFNELKLDKDDQLEQARLALSETGAPASVLSALDILILADREDEYKGYIDAGRFVTAFPTPESQKGFSPNLCIKMLSARTYLLEEKSQIEWEKFLRCMKNNELYIADPNPKQIYKDKFSEKNIRRQIALTKSGGEDKGGSAALSQSLTEIIAPLSKAMQNKITNAVDKDIKAIRKGIDKRVESDAKVLAEELLIPLKEEVEETRHIYLENKKEYTKKEEQVTARLKGTVAFMTKSEYKFLQNCLHPDRAPEDRRDKFAKAFDIVKKLEPGIAP